MTTQPTPPCVQLRGNRKYLQDVMKNITTVVVMVAVLLAMRGRPWENRGAYLKSAFPRVILTMKQDSVNSLEDTERVVLAMEAEICATIKEMSIQRTVWLWRKRP